MPNPYDLSSGIVVNVVSWVITVAIGVLVAQVIQRGWDEWRRGRWRLLIKRGDQTLLEHRLTARKAKLILSDNDDLSPYLKGKVSPFETLLCDIVVDGQKPRGEDGGRLLVVDKKARQIRVDLSYNKPCEQPAGELAGRSQFVAAGPPR